MFYFLRFACPQIPFRRKGRSYSFKRRYTVPFLWNKFLRISFKIHSIQTQPKLAGNSTLDIRIYPSVDTAQPAQLPTLALLPIPPPHARAVACRFRLLPRAAPSRRPPATRDLPSPATSSRDGDIDLHPASAVRPSLVRRRGLEELPQTACNGGAPAPLPATQLHPPAGLLQRSCAQQASCNEAAPARPPASLQRALGPCYLLGC